jgi:hypothetical protein
MCSDVAQSQGLLCAPSSALCSRKYLFCFINYIRRDLGSRREEGKGRFEFLNRSSPSVRPATVRSSQSVLLGSVRAEESRGGPHPSAL